MVRASAYPTVEWLLHSSRNPIPSTSTSSSNRIARKGSCKSDDVFRLLQAWKRDETTIAEHFWVRTPNGEEPVDLIIQRRGRRIGIRFSNRFESDYDRSDALVLVYGRFDTLYRVSAGSGRDSAPDIAYSILSMVPSWFTAEGRIKAGQLASASVLVNADSLGWKGFLSLVSGTITRIRLSWASDWVRSFERALSPPKLTSYADARLARPRR